MDPVDRETAEYKVQWKFPERLILAVERAKPEYLSTRAFCFLLIEEALTYRDAQARTRTQSIISNSNTLTSNSNPLTTKSNLEVMGYEGSVRGEKGEGDFGSTKSQVKPKLTIPKKLSKHVALIQEYWKSGKSGSKSETAWNLLISELSKIQDKYGEDVTRMQIELAINGKWQGILFSNFERFNRTPKGGYIHSPVPKVNQSENMTQDEWWEHLEKLEKQARSEMEVA